MWDILLASEEEVKQLAGSDDKDTTVVNQIYEHPSDKNYHTWGVLGH